MTWIIIIIIMQSHNEDMKMITCDIMIYNTITIVIKLQAVLYVQPSQYQ